MRVRVRSDSSDKTYQGQIGFISPRAEFTPKTVETTDLRTDLVYRLRIVVTNADAALRQGMPVTIEVDAGQASRSEEHTSELQSLMRISYAVFCLKKKTKKNTNN